MTPKVHRTCTLWATKMWQLNLPNTTINTVLWPLFQENPGELAFRDFCLFRLLSIPSSVPLVLNIFLLLRKNNAWISIKFVGGNHYCTHIKLLNFGQNWNWNKSVGYNRKCELMLLILWWFKQVLTPGEWIHKFTAETKMDVIVCTILRWRFHLQISHKCVKNFTAFFTHRPNTQYLSTVDNDTFTCAFVHCILVSMTMPEQKIFTDKCTNGDILWSCVIFSFLAYFYICARTF